MKIVYCDVFGGLSSANKSLNDKIYVFLYPEYNLQEDTMLDDYIWEISYFSNFKKFKIGQNFNLKKIIFCHQLKYDVNYVTRRLLHQISFIILCWGSYKARKIKCFTCSLCERECVQWTIPMDWFNWFERLYESFLLTKLIEISS